MKSLLNVPEYADPPQENLMVRNEYWQDDDWNVEEEFERIIQPILIALMDMIRNGVIILSVVALMI